MKAAIKQVLDAATIIALYVDMSGKIYLNHTKVGDIVDIKDETAVNKKRIIDVMKESFSRIVDSYGEKSTTK